MQNRNKIPKPISTFIKSMGILSLATHYDNTWISTVYYGADDNLDLYIVTDPTSKHGEQLSKNPQVAFAVFDSHTKITENKEGIQGQGVCTIVTDLPEIIKGISLWHKANPGKEGAITLDMLKKALDTKLYKLIPTYLKHFNKNLYKEDEYAVWES